MTVKSRDTGMFILISFHLFINLESNLDQLILSRHCTLSSCSFKLFNQRVVGFSADPYQLESRSGKHYRLLWLCHYRNVFFLHPNETFYCGHFPQISLILWWPVSCRVCTPETSKWVSKRAAVNPGASPVHQSCPCIPKSPLLP